MSSSQGANRTEPPSQEKHLANSLLGFGLGALSVDFQFFGPIEFPHGYLLVVFSTFLLGVHTGRTHPLRWPDNRIVMPG